MRHLPLSWPERHPKKSIAAVLFLVVAVVGGYKAMSGGGGEQQQGMPPTVVEAAKVESAALSITVSAVGSLIAHEGIVLRPEISGRVSEILFTEGQKLDKGQPLIQLDDTIYKAQLAQAEAEQAVAKQNYDRAQALVGRGAGTAQSRDEASARLRTAQASLELAQASLDKTRIVAPFTGTAGIRHVSVGDFVSPGQDLVSLQALDQLKVDFSVPERALSSLKIGQPVVLSVTAYPGETFQGEVSAIDPLIDANTRSVQLRAVVPNDSGKLRPGQFASVSLTLSETPNTLFVPASAIWPMGEQSFVFKITDGMAALAPVELVNRQANRVAVTGLAVGDEVVTAGHAKLMMFGGGQPTPVQVVDPHAPPPAADAKPDEPKADATPAPAAGE
jgi:membrane fusion protein (multidrug efflux system)